MCAEITVMAVVSAFIFGIVFGLGFAIAQRIIK